MTSRQGRGVKSRMAGRHMLSAYSNSMVCGAGVSSWRPWTISLLFDMSIDSGDMVLYFPSAGPYPATNSTASASQPLDQVCLRAGPSR
jgi:hypothetical protein